MVACSLVLKIKNLSADSAYFSTQFPIGESERVPRVFELKEIGEAIGMTEAEMLPWMKEYLLKAIRKYDKSKNVEDFTINEIHMWLDGDLRKKVEENLSYCQHMGIKETVLRYEGMEFPISVEMGWQVGKATDPNF